MFLFLKAQIRGGAAGDLFAQQVDVAGYTTKHGTYVSPHRALRHKRSPEAQSDLFTAPPKPTPRKEAKQPNLFDATAADRAEREGRHLRTEDPTFGFDVATDADLLNLRGELRSMTPNARAALEEEIRVRLADPLLRRDGMVAWTGTGWAVVRGDKEITTNPETGEAWTRHEATEHARKLQREKKAQRSAPDEGVPPPAGPGETLPAPQATAGTGTVAEAAERDAARRTAQAAKLREVAERQVAEAEGDLNADRQVNTARRARMAAGAIANAQHRIRVAETMRNLADAIENGEALHLSGVSTRAAVEALDQALTRAKYDALRAANGGFIPPNEAERAPRASDIRAAVLPAPYVGDMEARSLLETLPKNRHGELRAFLRDVAGAGRGRRVPDHLIPYLRAAMPDLKKRDSGRWSAVASLAEGLRDRDRFARIGITTDGELRQALVEYMQYRGGARSEDPVKRMERELAGRKDIGHDFFPTPPALAQRLVQEAGIEPGMKVLEPSAGKGDLADLARRAGGDVDVVELSTTLVPILEAKGHRVVGRDFEAFAAPEGGYDRIVMNPPFSNGLDADHVRRAYDMLKPGGRLVAITGEGIHFRQDQKAKDFRAWLAERGGRAEKLPDGSFKSAFRPTGVATRLVVIDKPADAQAVGPREGDTKTEGGVDYVLRDGRWHRATPEPQAPAAEEEKRDLLHADQATWLRAIYDAIMRRVDAGGAVVIATHTRSGQITARNRDAIRFHNGEIQIGQGNRWVSLGAVGTTIDALARDLGLPTSLERIDAQIAARDPAQEDARLRAAAGDLRPLIAAQDRAREKWATSGSVEDERALDSASTELRAAAKRLGLSDSDLDDILRMEEPEPPAAAGTPPPQAEGFHDAAALAAERGPAFTAADIARHWRGRNEDDALDHLHAHTADYALMPDGQRWMRMDDYLAGDPVAQMRDLHDALARPDLPPYARGRLGEQARRLAEAVARREPEEPAAAPAQPPTEPAEAAASEAPQPETAPPPQQPAEPWADFARPEELDYERARQAHAWNSFHPERRAQQAQAEFAADVNGVYRDLARFARTDEQRALLAEEMSRFKQGWLERYDAILDARGRTANPMVTGPARFPVARNEKALQAEQNRMREFGEWRERAIRAIRRRLEGSRTADQVRDDIWAALAKDIAANIATVRAIDTGDDRMRGMDRSAFVNSTANKLKRLAEAGQHDLVRRALDLIRERQAGMAKPFLSARHSAWSLADTPAAAAPASAAPAQPTGEEVVAEAGGATVVRNHDAGRVQIRFTGKPPAELRERLKREGWRWSPTNEAWQRMNTPASVESARRILSAGQAKAAA